MLSWDSNSLKAFSNIAIKIPSVSLNLKTMFILMKEPWHWLFLSISAWKLGHGHADSVIKPAILWKSAFVRYLIGLHTLIALKGSSRQKPNGLVALVTLNTMAFD